MTTFIDAYFEVCGLVMTTNLVARITENEVAVMVSQAFIFVADLDIAKSIFQFTELQPLIQLFSQIYAV